MKIEVISTEYNGNQRTDTVKHTFNMSDDIIRLGQLYYSLGQAMAKGENTSNIKAMINAQHEIIKGYGDDNESSGNETK